MSNKHFHYEDDRHVQQDIVFTDDDFEMTQVDASIHDQKLQSKPTTFLKDALNRFRKNKSSVVGGIILGCLIVLSLVLPVAISQNVYVNHPGEEKLPPKLFESGTGFWDGTQELKKIIYDQANECPADFNKLGVKEESLKTYPSTYDVFTKYGKGGEVSITSYLGTQDAYFISPVSYEFDALTYNYSLDVTIGEDSSAYEIFFRYLGNPEAEPDSFTYVSLLSESQKVGKLETIDITETLKEKQRLLSDPSKFSSNNQPSIVLATKAQTNQELTSYWKQVELKTDNDAQNTLIEDAGINFTDANGLIGIVNGVDTSKPAYFSPNAVIGIKGVEVIMCDFIYDPYAVSYGNVNSEFTASSLVEFVDNKYIVLDETILNKLVNRKTLTTQELATFVSSLQEGENYEHSPLIVDDQFEVNVLKVGSRVSYVVKGTMSKYRSLGYTSMPKFLFGTDANGKDLLKMTFSGLRTSLILGICVSAVCFTFGLIWGAIAGYFGGWTDIIMERFTDILSGLPWIVVMTLCIINLSNNFGTFALALCLTGWIGTSSLTRTQFYRFKRREYILAARTLGASDTRLIFKHILPNGIGTIITSAVLMIPSTIFSEATISYLGLGLKGTDTIALGVILSENQHFIMTYPYLILFPSVIMAIVMVCFNLFGNGLRDAFNPSLKGSE